MTLASVPCYSVTAIADGIVVPKVKVWFGFEGESVTLFQKCGSDGAFSKFEAEQTLG